MKKDIYIVGVFFVLLLSFTYYLSTFKEIGFGGEYRCIAEALLRGDGFSDPFCSPFENSGKTAWMPPFLSYFIAFLYIIFGQNITAVTWAQIFISSAAASFSLFLILRLANEVNSRYRHLCVILFSAFLLANPTPFLFSFHDVWLISLAIIVTLYVLYFHFVKRTLSVAPIIFLALFLPLISPILSFAFLSVTAFLYLKGWISAYLKHKEFRAFQKTERYSIYKLSAIVIAFSVPVLVWGSRNYVVFNKFIPVKSNLWFDFYQANVYDEDGLITGQTFANFHPMKNKEKLKEYEAAGEVELMDWHKKESLSYLNNNLPDYFEKVKNRFFNIFIFSKNPFDEEYKVDEEALTTLDISLLKQLKIVSANNSLNVQLDQERFLSIIKDIELDNKEKVTSTWQEVKNEYENEYNTPSRLLEPLLISGVPFFAWILSLVFINQFKKDNRVLFYIISVLYISYLLPYMMVTVYSRYVIPLSGVFSLLIYFSVVLVLNRITQLYSKKEESAGKAVVNKEVNPAI